jgi:hypothetical protein
MRHAHGHVRQAALNQADAATFGPAGVHRRGGREGGLRAARHRRSAGEGRILASGVE